MKTVGNDLVRHQLHENRKWYLGLGILLVLFGFVLLAALPFATLSVVFYLWRADDDRWCSTLHRSL